MADISKLKLPNGTTYDLKDSYVRTNYRALSNNDFDTINVTELNAGDLIVTGAARFLNTINGSISGNAATATNVAWSGVTGKPTTLGGYGITDAKIANGVITLGSNTITPLTSHQTVSNKGATLAWETTSTIATIGGTDIKVTMPRNPNTNTTYTLGADTKNNKITLTPSSGDVQSITVPYATSAGSASSATKATQDESGNNIKASYASSISISDHTITLKNKNGVSLGTVTVPDNNTWRGIQNNLTSTSTTDSLSAAQGKILNDTKLEKTTYEYNKEISFGSSGKLLIGKFPCYDSNVTIHIDSTTGNTYHATAVLATQNINTSGGGTLYWRTYGDSANTVTPNLYLYYPNNSRYIEIYFSPSTYSKNLIHIQCMGLSATPTNICESVDSIPSTATTKPINTFSGLVIQGTTVGTNTYTDSNPKIYFQNSNASQNISLTFTDYDSVVSPASLTLNGNQGSEWFIAPNIKATTKFTGNLTGNVTGNCSGSSGSCTGNAVTATTASKLGSSNVGSATQPIYLSAGTATACTYTLGKSVPSDAEFTDTKYTAGTGLTLSDKQFSVSSANASTIMNLLTTGSSAPTDNDYYIAQYAGGGTTTTTYHRRPHSALWSYIKAKADTTYVNVTGDTMSGNLAVTNVLGIAQTAGNVGGISLYGGTGQVDTYGIAFRLTSNKEKHGYVQGDWATYFTMNSGATTRGWVFRTNTTNGNVASISGGGNAVFNGSVTVGGNTTNTSGVRQVYNETTKSLDFVFVA